MKKIIALVCLVGCMGILFGCTKDTNNTEETTTTTAQVETETEATTQQVETTAQKKETTTAAQETTKKKTKKKETTTQKAKKTQAKGANLIGSWTWEGGIFVYNFKKDGTGSYKTGSEAKYFTYKVKNNKVVINYKGEGKITMPYTVDGKTLIMKDVNNDDVIYYKN